MILVFIEDGTLDVIADVQQAQRNYEGVDVEASVCEFYDMQGNYLEAHFTTPNRSGKFLGLVRWSKSGIYTLRPALSGDPLWLALFEIKQLNANPWFASMDALKAELRKNGVVVERPAA